MDRAVRGVRTTLGFLRTRIGQRFLAVFLAISLVPLALAGWFAVWSSEAAIRQQTLAILRGASDGAEAQIREFLGHLKEQALDLAQDERVRGALEASSQPGVPAWRGQANPGIPKLLTASRQRIPEVLEVLILTEDGHVAASSSLGNVGKDLSATSCFVQGRESFFNGEVEKDPATGEVTWFMSAPIHAESNHRLLGVVAVRIDPGSLSALTTGRRILAQGADTQSFRIGDTGETYIVNRERLMITESRYLTGAVLRVRVNTLPVRTAQERGEEITANYKDYRGIEVSGASMLLRDTGWVVLTEVDFSQAFAPVQRLSHGLVAVTVGLGLVVVLLAANSTRRIIRPIQMYHESDRALAVGDPTAAIVSEEGLPQDELGELVRKRNARVRAVFAYQQQLEERSAKLKEALAELEHMSYSIIHDMRAPLRAIIGFGDMITEKDAKLLSDESQDHLVRMKSAALRMDHLIRDVLNYAALVRGELSLQPVNVSELLRGICETYPEFQSRRAQISIPPDLPAVQGNEAALTQCFSNLLDNAIKFVAPGQIPRVRILGEMTGERVRISIQDNGVGIPPTMQERVFGLFQRGHNSGQGTGVGLAIVRKAAERMGGRVGVMSAPGRGSTFWIELQAASPLGNGNAHSAQAARVRSEI
jgi:signal transduction histidine kinase